MANPRFLRRRNFLAGAAGAALGLPLLESLDGGPLRANSLLPVKRFVSFHTSSGVETERFWPALGPLSAAAFSGKGTEALAPFASRILIPRGVHGYPVGTWTGHGEGTAQALTAASSQDAIAHSVSIDQVIAKALNPSGREALVMRPGGRDHGVAGFNSISYRNGGEMVGAESNPYLTYRAITSMVVEPPSPDDEAAQRLLRKRQSVLDFVKEEFDELNRIELSQSDREKLDQHFSLVRDVENGLSGDPAVVACVFDGAEASEIESIQGDTVEWNGNFPTMARHFVKLTALGLACQYTHSAVIQWGAAVAGSPTYNWEGMNHSFRHHPLSHGTTEDFGGGDVNGYKDMLFEIDRWNVGEFAKLLALLDSYGEGGGKTLLDNTVVMFSSEFSHGQGHTTGDLPIIIAGGAGYFKLGESLVLNGSKADIGGVSGQNGFSHKMLCTVLNAVGVPHGDWNGGAELSELRA